MYRRYKFFPILGMATYTLVHGATGTALDGELITLLSFVYALSHSATSETSIRLSPQGIQVLRALALPVTALLRYPLAILSVLPC